MVAAGAYFTPSRGMASDLSLGDRVDKVYGSQFHFNLAGEPQISIGLMEGQDEVRLSSTRPIFALPSGEGGTAITGGRRWHVRRIKGNGSRQRFTVVLEQLPITENRQLAASRKGWTAKGLEIDVAEVGGLFGVSGKVLDTRKFLITTGDFGKEAEARRLAKKLVARHGALGKLHPRIDNRSSGVFVARDLDHDVSVRVEGVLWFEAEGGAPITVHDTQYGTTIGKSGREDRTYRGQIYVAVDRHGKLAAVNLVSETEILSGLVPAEIFASAPFGALKAQAVAARGQLLAKVGTRHLDDPFLLCAHQHCQVYAGKVREHPRTNKAVRETRGRVLMRPNGTHLVDTVYSANSGGHTENNELVWPSPPDPQLRGRPDPLVGAQYRGGITDANLAQWLRDSPAAHSRPGSRNLQQSYRWEATVDPAAIPGRGGVSKKLGKIRNLEVLERGRSGRAIRLRVTGSRGEVDISGELRIRRALGDLRSSMFLILPERDRYGRFRLIGGGHGHGVGLCQHGAMGMAASGKSFESILAHYYRGSKLVTLW